MGEIERNHDKITFTFQMATHLNNPPIVYDMRRSSIVVGRGEKSDLKIVVGSISKEHCRIDYTPHSSDPNSEPTACRLQSNRLLIQDLNSSNGTFMICPRTPGTECGNAPAREKIADLHQDLFSIDIKAATRLEPQRQYPLSDGCVLFFGKGLVRAQVRVLSDSVQDSADSRLHHIAPQPRSDLNPPLPVASDEMLLGSKPGKQTESLLKSESSTDILSNDGKEDRSGECRAIEKSTGKAGLVPSRAELQEDHHHGAEWEEEEEVCHIPRRSERIRVKRERQVEEKNGNPSVSLATTSRHPTTTVPTVPVPSSIAVNRWAMARRTRNSTVPTSPCAPTRVAPSNPKGTPKRRSSGV